MKLIITVFINFLGVLILPDFAECRDNPVKIGVLAKRDKESCMEKWSPTAEYLSNQIPGSTFTIVPLESEEIHLMVHNGEVDFVITNPYNYVELEVFYGVSRIATLKNLLSDKVNTVYGGVIFTRKDREDIEQLADLKGKSYMAPHVRAFASWVSVLRCFQNHGIDPERDFKIVQFDDTQDAVVYAVRDGKIDAGSVRTGTLERMDMEGKIEIEEFKVINMLSWYFEFPFLHSTKLYPEWPFVKVRHTSDAMAEKVTIALLGITPENPAAVAGRYAGWTVPLNYQSVHECLKELRLGPYEDFGIVSLTDVFKQYRYWFITALIFLIVIIIAMVYVTQLNRRLRLYQGRLRSLTSELSLTEERERRRIAIELHDHISQTLAFSKIKLETVLESAEPGNHKEHLLATRGLIDRAIDETKSLVFALSPPILYDLGFEAALEWLSRSITEQHGIRIDFESDGRSELSDKDISIALFQSVRELLINAVKHARASRIKLSLNRDGGNIQISVEDNGIGFSSSLTYPRLKRDMGFGLFNIQERIDYLGGKIKIESEPEHGTRVTIALPLTNQTGQKGEK